MCGRYTITKSIEQICNEFELENTNIDFSPSYNVAPNQILPIITNNKSNTLSFMNWGLVPFWAKDRKISNKLINSRVETILEKPSFKYAMNKRRCLVVADGYYEWKMESNKKNPYRIVLNNQELFAMAGIWEEWKYNSRDIYNSFSIITQDSNDKISNIHHRMPAIISKKYYKQWLLERKVEKALSLIKPTDNDKIDYYKVSSQINSPINNYKELVNEVI